MEQLWKRKGVVPLEDLLQQCTVKLTIPELHQQGTGFFVAPNLILTCNHVVSGQSSLKCLEHKRVKIRWQDQEDFAEAEVIKCCPDPIDLALLSFKQVSSTTLPYVCLDTKVEARQNLYFFGYPDRDFPNGCPVTLTYEGLTGDTPPYIIFNRGQVRPGMSGSALLNQDTGKVCGIVKFTRDAGFDLGGGAVPTKTILSEFPELVQYQLEFYQGKSSWDSLLKDPTIDRNELLDKLSSCPVGIFRKVIFYLQIPAGVLSSNLNSQSIQATELLEWLELQDEFGIIKTQNAYLRAIGKL